MKKAVKFLFVITLLLCCVTLSACQSKEAQIVDEKILALESKDVSLEIWENISEIDGLIDALSEKEYGSLKNIATYKEIVSNYEKLEEKAVLDIENKISAIPPVENIKLSSETIINDASNAYEGTTTAVKQKIDNYSVLQEAQTKIDAVKKASWVSCSYCGGDGVAACSKCGGRGSRKMPYTTPNGKTWQVWADCATTQTCGRCSGRGGVYVEKTEVSEQVDTEE